MFSAVGPTTSPASTAEFVTNSLTRRLPEFIYDPDNGCTFNVWFNRYEDVIVQDGSTLDEVAKARLIVSKLDAAAYARFTNHILPKRPSELCFGDTVKTPEFIYDPDNGCTFNVWFNRYEDVIVQDGSTLDEVAKARLIVSKLDAAAYARFTNHILPKRPSELCFGDTVKTLKELFGHNTDYTGMVNRRHEMAEFNAITPEQMKCLVWICGLHTPDDADIRSLALRKMEDNPQTTLKQLSLEIQQFLNIRRDAKLLGSPPSLLQPEVNAVTIKKNCTQNPPSPCFRYGGSHWARNCYFIDKTCHNCKRLGHKNSYCKNFSNKRSRNRRKSGATSNVVVIASTGTDVAPVNRIYRKVKINGATIQMRLDTGADVTLLSIKDWIKINRPKLLPPLVKLKSADNKDIKIPSRYLASTG
ncbi:unnamed protein product [Toxocara canis]|uniref:Peptidase A2 domain-containing protein n=1 Tax=Toxocara canis TaxID=6265 RepID=A0A183UDG6_TOXCA|nr:unnamed protein product [Toxocara canis]